MLCRQVLAGPVPNCFPEVEAGFETAVPSIDKAIRSTFPKVLLPLKIFTSIKSCILPGARLHRFAANSRTLV